MELLMDHRPKFLDKDPWLEPYERAITGRAQMISHREDKITQGKGLFEFASGHLYYGLHKTDKSWFFREWAPHAIEMYLVGDFSDWQIQLKYALCPVENGNWEIELPLDALKHQQQFKLLLRWNGGEAYRLPAYGQRMVQDPATKVFNAQIWSPPETFSWKVPHFARPSEPPLIYEAHTGMASMEQRTATFNEFRDNVIPRIKKAGYNVIQLMAVQEHPYYGSFGYHVSNFYAVSSRFGTPEDLKSLVDTAHENGIAVIMDLIHSHSVKNVDEGLGFFDGTPNLYFHSDVNRREHPAWDSLCFDYGRPEVLHFLLSNCKYWLEEYKLVGFRFDGITSMIYFNHGLGKDFTDYGMYYDGGQDEDAIAYLTLANKLIHKVKPSAITIAEEMSGMPGLAASNAEGGYGFDYRMAMGLPDYWIKVIKEKSDEQWSVSTMYHEASTHRSEEKTISYCESHDQALVGDKTIAFRLMDKEMYFCMSRATPSVIIDRGIALHKMIRLFSMAAGGGGYLTFMGNEFGHPEWIDFPREGNGWSYKYARRQWNLESDPLLRYTFLSEFDKAMIHLERETSFLKDAWPVNTLTREGDQIVSFKRGGYHFIFNFSPERSYTEYGIPVHENGSYKIVLCSDDSRFGGFDRVDEKLTYDTLDTPDLGQVVRLYIPNRIVMVLRKIKLS